jgi:hypothetical protein
MVVCHFATLKSLTAEAEKPCFEAEKPLFMDVPLLYHPAFHKRRKD